MTARSVQPPAMAKAPAYIVGFSLAYLALTVLIAALTDLNPRLASSLAAPLLWGIATVLDGASLLPWGLEPRAPSPDRPARILALRWVLCGLALANAALLLWRAFVPGDSLILVGGLGFRLLPLDVRATAQGFDLLALGLGAALALLGVSELRLRLLAQTRTKPA